MATARWICFLPRTAQGSLLAFGDAQAVDLLAQPAHPLSGIEDVHTALWGDIDNDGLTDVYLLRDGPNQLWRQTGRGRMAGRHADRRRRQR